MKKALALVFLILFVAGCTKKDSDSPVIAKINGKAITKEDFINEINKMPEWARGRFLSDEGKKQFLDELIKKELIYNDARGKGLHRDKDFKDKVSEFEKMTLVRAVLEKEVEEKAKLDPAEVKNFYDKNPDEFMIGSEVRARHILVETEKEAEELIKRIKKGEDFSELAKKFSKDRGSVEAGGDLGFFGRGRMVPEFEKVVFGLKSGEVSGPVKTRFGYHIVKVIDRKEGRQGSYEEARESITKQLAVEKQKSLFESYIEKLRKDAKIETDAFEAELKALKIEQPQIPQTGN